jgi:PmbA protein
MAALKETAEKAVEWLRGEGLEAEIYLSRSEERGLDRRDGELDGIQSSVAEGMGLRVLAEGRMAFACAAGVSLDVARELAAQAKAQLPHLQADAAKAIPAARAGGGDEALAASLWDDGLFTEEWSSVVERLQAAEAAALAADKRIGSILRAGYGEARGEVVIASTNGGLTYERGASCSVGLSTLSEAGGDLQVGSAFDSARRRGQLDWNKVGVDAALRTTALLGAAKPPSGRRSVIFDPWIAGEFLDLISSLLCADQVQRGKSLLSGKMGKSVGSSLVTFIDDPRRLGGLSSSLFDDEGLATSRKVMIEGGVVREFFYDSYTGARDGVGSNASAGRGSYRGLPSPSCSNFYLAPGTMTREALLKDTRRGLLILDVMGMHMADPISGEFSVGVSGLLVEDGKLDKPVKAAMISGNLLELLGRMDAVADDLTFHGSMGAPTFRVADMTVA